MSKFFLIFLLMFISFYYGLQVGTKKIFPYNELIYMKSYLKNKSYKPEVVMFGDSITYAASWNKMENEFKILNRGINGLESDELVKKIEEFDTKIDKAFLMIGINDFLNYKDVDEVYNNYLKIIELLEKKDIKIYIQSTLFVDKDINQIINEKVNKLNKKIKQLANEKNIVYINLNKKLALNDFLNKEFTTDGIHLNEKAYDIWYDLIKEYL